MKAAPAQDPDAVAAGWCDVWDRKPFRYPGLADGAQARQGKARWVNVWATWCKPCIEELPRIAAFKDRLVRDGARVDVELLAADEPDAFNAFVAENDAAKSSVRLSDPEHVADWVGTLGLRGGAGLPLHLFVDGSDQLRCARLGGVGEDDYDEVLAVTRAM